MLKLVVSTLVPLASTTVVFRVWLPEATLLVLQGYAVAVTPSAKSHGATPCGIVYAPLSRLNVTEVGPASGVM
jgi:hypothetical protein